MKNIKPVEVISVLLIILFTYTATSKLLEYDKFVFQMRLAPVPYIIPLAPFIGILVILAELLIVVALLTKKFRLWGLFASLFLLISFEIYISTMLISGLNLPCSCGGIISFMGWKQHLFFNGAFIVLCIIGIVFCKKQNVLREGPADNHSHLQDLSHTY
ncbi:MauE/DoxX family redox-associated membrane protein [Mucilaginibacter sp.]|uniref:MauE/DoxX family redox-associated membrane protein n=1 Tax=Mucilaginibacter sp. TaxID=1882438 RepID=UPI002606E5BA|nr:MauE/DoxX family redox-associated membrane protein [Mucilaginibacter sp.]MDB4918416.1 hypothetical protein [Mucilaginibacter sp.]